MRDLSRPGRSPVHARNGMAATSHPLATQVAVKILQDGGNAMDAAIAACAVQCVVEPESTGIGGDCFCMYAPGGSDQVVAFNGSGKAPQAADVAYFQEQGIDAIEQNSPHSVTIPGAVDAWFQLSRDHGRLPFAQLLEPAIDYAENGFAIASRVHTDFVRCADLLKQDPISAAQFLIDGEAPKVGDVVRYPQLAKSLEAIAEGGRDAFYRGWIADDMVDCLQALGGLQTQDDFATATGDYVTPIETEYRGHRILECPPNGQGVIALLLLNMMRQVPVDPMGPLSVERMHLEIEAAWRAYQARDTYLADTTHSQVPVDALLSDQYAKDMVASIDPETAGPSPVLPQLAAHNDTVYISVVDKDRNACSFINTLFHGFGSGITAPKSGILLHNRGQGFSLNPNHPNCIAPGKRPMHTIIPALALRDGRTAMSFGVMGGHYQAFGHMQFLTRHLDYGMDLQEAMDAPRFMIDPMSGEVEVEGAIDDETVESLRERGHTIYRPEVPIGGSQAIHIDWEQGVLTGASDPRKDGCAIGY